LSDRNSCAVANDIINLSVVFGFDFFDSIVGQRLLSESKLEICSGFA